MDFEAGDVTNGFGKWGRKRGRKGPKAAPVVQTAELFTKGQWLPSVIFDFPHLSCWPYGM